VLNHLRTDMNLLIQIHLLERRGQQEGQR
jgi:hypothetical protein